MSSQAAGSLHATAGCFCAFPKTTLPSGLESICRESQHVWHGYAQNCFYTCDLHASLHRCAFTQTSLGYSLSLIYSVSFQHNFLKWTVTLPRKWSWKTFTGNNLHMCVASYIGALEKKNICWNRLYDKLQCHSQFGHLCFLPCSICFMRNAY